MAEFEGQMSPADFYELCTGGERAVDVQAQLIRALVEGAENRRLARIFDHEDLTISTIEPSAIRPLLEAQAMQIFKAAQLIFREIANCLNVISINGPMGAGKTTVIAILNEAFKASGRKTAIVALGGEYERYNAGGDGQDTILHSGLGIGFNRVDHAIRVTENTGIREILWLLDPNNEDRLQSGDVMFLVECFMAVPGSDLREKVSNLEEIVEAAEAVGVKIIFDNLLRFANAWIHSVVRRATELSELTVGIFGFDALDPLRNGFGTIHLFFFAKWVEELASLQICIEDIPNPADPIERIARGAVFDQCLPEGEAILLWTIAVAELLNIVRYSPHKDDIGRLIEQIEASDRFYKELYEEGRFRVPLLELPEIDPRLIADIKRMLGLP